MPSLQAYRFCVKVSYRGKWLHRNSILMGWAKRGCFRYSKGKYVFKQHLWKDVDTQDKWLWQSCYWCGLFRRRSEDNVLPSDGARITMSMIDSKSDLDSLIRDSRKFHIEN
jgi:hypothetical protein